MQTTRKQADRPHIIETIKGGHVQRYLVANLRRAVIRAAVLDPFSKHPEKVIALRPASVAEIKRHGGMPVPSTT